MVRPDSRRVSRVPRYLGKRQEPIIFRLQGYHLLWLDFPDHSTRRLVCNSFAYLAVLRVFSHYPYTATAASYIHGIGLGCSAFARHYLRNRFAFFSSGYLDVSVRPLTSPFGVTRHYPGRVTPFGNLRIKGCLLLPEAFRRLPRPSSALCP